MLFACSHLGALKILFLVLKMLGLFLIQLMEQKTREIVWQLYSASNSRNEYFAQGMFIAALPFDHLQITLLFTTKNWKSDCSPADYKTRNLRFLRHSARHGTLEFVSDAVACYFILLNVLCEAASKYAIVQPGRLNDDSGLMDVVIKITTAKVHCWKWLLLRCVHRKET